MFAGRHLSINVIGSGKNDEINENDFFYKNKLLFERISVRLLHENILVSERPSQRYDKRDTL